MTEEVQTPSPQPSPNDARINDLTDKFLGGTSSHEEIFELYGLLETTLDEEKKKNPHLVRVAVLVTLFWTVRGILGVLQAQKEEHERPEKTK